jgi:transposase
MNTLNERSIVVGVDVHKYSHTAVALNAWGSPRGSMDFSNQNLDAYLDWLGALGPKDNLNIGLEDVNGYGVHLVEALRKGGYSIRYVPAVLTERSRAQSTKRHKSDAVDAERVGKVLLHSYHATFPAKETIASERELLLSRSLDLLLLERRDLVSSKTIVKNQLHGLIHEKYTESYRAHCPRSFSKKAIRWFLEDLAGDISSLGTSITRRLNRLLLIESQLYEISKEITRVCAAAPEIVALTTIYGCGMLTAAEIVAETVTVRRFPDKHHFAMYAGVVPIPHSSGRKQTFHTNPFGNRKLNRSLHTIALSQIALKDNEGEVYYKKKLVEGKTKLWALRCLKHQISKVVYQALKRC